MSGTVPARADVSVVVVARGDEPGLAPSITCTLASLGDAARERRGAALRGDRLGGELVLVLHDVAPLPAGVAADPRVRVVAAPGVSGGRARNIGVAAARGRYLLFTEPDARVPSGWVRAMTAPLRAGRADLVAGAVVPASDGPVRLADADAAAYLDVVPDPPVVGHGFSGVSMAATRAVFEAVGFDEALGTARYPYTADVALRRDAVGAGFREAAVAGVPVVRHLPSGALGRGALAARARAHGRGAAYLDRHAREPAPAALPVLVRLVGRALLLAWAEVRGARPSVLLPAHAALARHRELLRLRRVPVRVPPRSAAGDVPGGAGAPRSAAPVALVTRDSVPATPLPSPPPAAAVGPARGRTGDQDQGARGSALDLWASAGLRRRRTAS
ncbi:glycosyltransferase [Cellulosimicrobium cellulans]|uniref:glycosyltransferase n=1 Tax=Cellulosimicrobium cellulans TaxID=1710 RepID=UPI00130E7495|nr:glycosyltransferase [Cellulosimicrobium cellulans]